MIQEKQIELIYVCTRCLKQHKTAAAAAGCCYVISVFWKCNICASVFPYEKKSLAENHEEHYKPETVFLIGGKHE